MCCEFIFQRKSIHFNDLEVLLVSVYGSNTQQQCTALLHSLSGKYTVLHHMQYMQMYMNASKI